MFEKTLNKITLIAILICGYANAQTSDFIVTASHDTIYVNKITLTDFEVKTKTGDTKKKYHMDNIISYYILKENKHYQRIQLEKKEPKAVNRYDRHYDELSSAQSENPIKYKYIQRLTDGKVKLFTEVLIEYTPSGLPNMPSTASKTYIYYISVYDSKLEKIDKKFKFESLLDNGKLKLTKEVHELLKTYLYGNDGITKQLDRLFVSKPVADEEQIISLINEYNVWAGANK